MVDIVEDDDNADDAVGLPVWLWAAGIIVITAGLLWYLLS